MARLLVSPLNSEPYNVQWPLLSTLKWFSGVVLVPWCQNVKQHDGEDYSLFKYWSIHESKHHLISLLDNSKLCVWGWREGGGGVQTHRTVSHVHSKVSRSNCTHIDSRALFLNFMQKPNIPNFLSGVYIMTVNTSRLFCLHLITVTCYIVGISRPAKSLMYCSLSSASQL